MSSGYHAPSDPVRRNVISQSDLAKHTSTDDAWIAIHGLVADVTKFKDEHPGGESILMRHVGTDCTEDYDDVDHSDEARIKLIEEVAIGVLEGKEDTPGIPVETKLGDIQDSGWSSMQIVLVTAVVAAVAVGVISSVRK
ncbi:hypothetical protein FOZ62_002955 [Perkinsus olseni]|uniref:Cytochrome b5 heme-binding domain-containing protein n=1 Tax=Perkinsus olseni TaxID=32597 RepID=A0A7J6U348_PEROL|nr:hypothetical protein FOZ62_002955 [Perkinsus olseni]